METTIKNWSDIMPTLMTPTQLTAKNKDNLFNAEKRDIIKRKHGCSSAEWTTVEQLMNDGGW